MFTLVTNLQHRLDNERQDRLPSICLPWLLTSNTNWTTTRGHKRKAKQKQITTMTISPLFPRMVAGRENQTNNQSNQVKLHILLD